MGYSTDGVGIVKIVVSIEVEVIDVVATEPSRPHSSSSTNEFTAPSVRMHQVGAVFYDHSLQNSRSGRACSPTLLHYRERGQLIKKRGYLNFFRD